MSRVGKKPIPVPKGVTVSAANSVFTVKGPKGTLELPVDPRFEVKQDKDELVVSRPSDVKDDRAKHGLYRALLNNLVQGVSEGFTKNLEIQGIGYRAKVEGSVLELVLGYSHPIKMDIPEGLTVKVDKNVNIAITGIDKQAVGQFAAEIRIKRKVEPYKGKGIRYQGEHVRQKEGKKGGKGK